MPQFVDTMLAPGCETRMFPFSCWCNGGGQHEKGVHRQHRHMILVHPKGRFDSDFWSKIRIRSPSDLPFVPGTRQRMRHFKSLHKLPVKGPFHLIHILAYVSKQESACNGTFDERERRCLFTTLNHFWIMTSLPRQFKLELMLQWDGGLMQLLTWEHQSSKDVEMAQRPRQRVRGQWRIAIRDLPKAPRSQVLPVARHLQPVMREGVTTDHYVWLLGGVRMYFEEEPSLLALDSIEWAKRQAARGNVFCDVVGGEFWTPRPYLQRLLSSVEQIRLEYEAMKEKLQGDRAFSEMMLANEVAALKGTVDRRDAEVAALQEALRKKDLEDMASRKADRNVLRDTLVVEQAETAALKAEVASLRAEVAALRETVEKKCGRNAGPSFTWNNNFK